MGEANQVGPEEESAEESQLWLDETVTGNVDVVLPAGLAAQDPNSARGYSEIDDADSFDDAVSGGANGESISDSDVNNDDDDDDSSVHSFTSDARHDLDYLRDVEGKLPSELLVAS